MKKLISILIVLSMIFSIRLPTANAVGSRTYYFWEISRFVDQAMMGDLSDSGTTIEDLKNYAQTKLANGEIPLGDITLGNFAGGYTFVNGVDFDRVITLQNDTEIDVLAETTVNGTTLRLDNITIYSNMGDIPNQVGTLPFKQMLPVIKEQAKLQGFEELVLTWERVPGSSSANPGHLGQRIIDLLK